VTILDDLAQRGPIDGFFGDGLAEVERLRCDRVDGEYEMVGGDRAGDIIRQRLDAVHGFFGGRMFEDDAEAGEVVSELAEVCEEVLFCVEDRDVL
jgi:hypothetical protein